MARRLTTNQEIAGSIPASVIFLLFWLILYVTNCDAVFLQTPLELQIKLDE